MAYREENLEEKIASIKVALKELGNSLENDGKIISIERSSPLDFENSKIKKQISSEKVDAALLDYEREKNTMLEIRISHKDELVTEMTILQNELYSNIEELQYKVNALKSDLEYSQHLNIESKKEIESFSRLLQEKDAEISELINERDIYLKYYFDKEQESKTLNFERTEKEPNKNLMNGLVFFI